MLQPLLGLLEADQLLSIGLDATPATHPDLLEAMPPLDYFGFDAALFGVLPIVIWGGIMELMNIKIIIYVQPCYIVISVKNF